MKSELINLRSLLCFKSKKPGRMDLARFLQPQFFIEAYKQKSRSYERL